MIKLFRFLNIRPAFQDEKGFEASNNLRKTMMPHSKEDEHEVGYFATKQELTILAEIAVLEFFKRCLNSSIKEDFTCKEYFASPEFQKLFDDLG